MRILYYLVKISKTPFPGRKSYSGCNKLIKFIIVKRIDVKII